MNFFEKYVFKWEIAGIFWIVFVGSLLHFTYEWSGNSKIVALFSPVNESVWEHLKLGYWALVFFMFIEYWFIKEYINNFFIGKTLGIIGMSLFIVIIFCSYAFITGESSLFIDIGSFIVGSIICQLISINIMKIKFSKKVERLGVYTFIFIGIIFTFFTFFPPNWGIFRDSGTGKYGIQP